MKTFNLFSVRARLMISFIFAIMVPTLIIGMLAYQSSKQSLTDAGYLDLHNIVNASYSMATALNEEVKKGNISKEAAQSQMQTLLVGPKAADGSRDLKQSAIKVGTTGYLFAQDSTGKLTMHPKLEGTNIWDLQGGVGKMIAEHPAGELRYAWQNPGESEPRYKITVTKHFADWDWILAVGSYEEEFFGAAYKIRNDLYIALAVEFVVGLLFSLWLSSRLTRPLDRLGVLMGELGRGDLTHRSSDSARRDEYGQLARHFNQAADNLASLIRQVSESTQQVTAAAQQMAAGTEQTSRSSEQIARALLEVAQDSEGQLQGVSGATQVAREISHGVESIDASMQAVSATSMAATARAQDGQHVVETTVEQMNRIDSQVTSTAEAMNELHSKTEQIGDIITSITTIAAQTNLLALNAAIEAARAGEAGRGFSVVADEVRKLAEQSTAAAQDTAELIHEIQEGMSLARGAMGEGAAAVHEGLEHIRQTGQSFHDILLAVEEVSLQVEHVMAGVVQVRQGASGLVAVFEEVGHTSEMMAAGTQTVSASVQETNAAVEEIKDATSQLAEMAEGLKDTVAAFRV